MRMIPSLEGKHSTLSMHYIKVPKIGSFIQIICLEGQQRRIIRAVYAKILIQRIGKRIHIEHQKVGLQVNYDRIIEICM